MKEGLRVHIFFNDLNCLESISGASSRGALNGGRKKYLSRPSIRDWAARRLIRNQKRASWGANKFFSEQSIDIPVCPFLLIFSPLNIRYET
jgi:hypothetical protein